MGLNFELINLVIIIIFIRLFKDVITKLTHYFVWFNNIILQNLIFFCYLIFELSRSVCIILITVYLFNFIINHFIIIRIIHVNVFHVNTSNFNLIMLFCWELYIVFISALSFLKIFQTVINIFQSKRCIRKSKLFIYIDIVT